MKIVHVLPALSKGGGERVMAELADHAAQTGHQVTIIASNPVDSSLLRDRLHPEVCVRYVSDSVGSKARRYLSIFLWLWRHRSWLAEQDILHCHLTYGAVFGTAVGIWRNVSGAKRPLVVETYHAVGMNIPKLHRWTHSQLAVRRDALVLMAEDEYWSKYQKDHPDLLSKIIPNGISVSSQGSVSQEARKTYRQELGIPDDCRFVVGTVGMLRPDRQPWLNLPVFAEVARVLGPEVHFVIAGGGSEKDFEHMRSLIIEHGLQGRVHLPGLAFDPSLPRSIIDLYITLNVGSITGIAGLEAASSSLPVLAIQLLSEYQCGPDDWIWSSDDSMKVAEQAIKLIRSPDDRQALADRQADYFRAHHTTETMAASYYSIYQIAIERSRKKANTSN